MSNRLLFAGAGVLGAPILVAQVAGMAAAQALDSDLAAHLVKGGNLLMLVHDHIQR